MPVTINGNGTITGIAVGGLPDGVVDADTLASSSVTDAKITAVSSSKLSGALPAISGASLTGLSSGGIDGYDVWRLTSDLTGNQLPITTGNMERADNSYMTKIGTGMSYSSGVFSFPGTGIWRVTWIGNTEHATSTHQTVYTIEVTTNNGTAWDSAARTRQGVYKMSTCNSFGNATTSCIVDVTDTSNVKVRFEFIDGQGDGILQGDTDGNQTTFEFIRLGDT